MRDIREVTGPIRVQSDEETEFRADVLTLLDLWGGYLDTVPGSRQAHERMTRIKGYPGG